MKAQDEFSPEPLCAGAPQVLFTGDDVDALAYGAAFLGSGGGGDPYVGRLILRQELQGGRAVRIIDPQALPDGARIAGVGAVGAPTVLIERLPSLEAFLRAIDHVRRERSGRIHAIMAIEAGGLNATLPVAVASRLGLPIVDADAMGRAFPESQMMTFAIHGVTTSPLCLADDHRQSVAIEARSNEKIEQWMRPLVTEMGGAAMAAAAPLSGADVKRAGVWRTLTTQIAIGRRVIAARAAKEDPVAALLAHFREDAHEPRFAAVLYAGKIADVDRATASGFTTGRITIASARANEAPCEIIFKNENLIALKDGRPLAMTPDIITLVEADTAEPVTTENVRYGQRVKAIGLAAPAILRTEAAIAATGPRAFRLDRDYVPLEKLRGHGCAFCE